MLRCRVCHKPFVNGPERTATHRLAQHLHKCGGDHPNVGYDDAKDGIYSGKYLHRDDEPPENGGPNDEEPANPEETGSAGETPTPEAGQTGSHDPYERLGPGDSVLTAMPPLRADGGVPECPECDGAMDQTAGGHMIQAVGSQGNTVRGKTDGSEHHCGECNIMVTENGTTLRAVTKVS